jgi:uncharacterized protein (DUF608 family)
LAKEAESDWPVLRAYDQDHLGRIGMPLGGIGTGTVCLGGRGQLFDWEITNRPSKRAAREAGCGMDSPGEAVFVLRAGPAGRPPILRAIEGALEPPYDGPFGSREGFAGLPRFRHCRFEAAYPFARVRLRDGDVPLEVRIEAFNPLVPGDAEASGIPMAVLRYVLVNRTGRRVSATVCGTVRNLIRAEASRTALRRSGTLTGLFMRPTEGDPLDEGWGTMALVTTARNVSCKRNWPVAAWRTALLTFWQELSEEGLLRDAPGDSRMGSLAAAVAVPPKSTRDVTFLLTWHFPNRYTWTPRRGGGRAREADIIGNHYTTKYRDAWDVAKKEAKRLAALERQTKVFLRAFCESDLPAEVKEAALCNLSTLRTQTCFRTPDGRFYGWEGCGDREGCCHGSCTHVWNYEQATAFLFGDLSCRMREVEFAHATDRRGRMSFRVHLPLRRAREFAAAAADGQMGCIMKMYRDWRLSGDDRLLRGLWPKVRKAMEFCWIPGGWDADRDGVMEGCQHNTMDVEYFGPNPQMGTWYLGALRAAEEMAAHLGDEDFANRCRHLFGRGSRWLDENLFNGEYYEQQIRPARRGEAIAAGLSVGMGAADPRRPAYQLGQGCLVDQLVGQYMAHVCGLGHLLRPAHVRRTLRSVMRYNFREHLHGHFNHLRTFALNDESGLVMASFPRGRPEVPFPYHNEVMTGFEYTAAVHMIQEGRAEDGLKCIRAIRARYDGRRRSPFNEAECGHHYARAMASWAAVLAWTGFRYDGVTAEMTFAAPDRPVRWFWSNGRAWGGVELRPARGRTRVRLAVLSGRVPLSTVALEGRGRVRLPRRRTLRAGQSIELEIEHAAPRGGRGNQRRQGSRRDVV